MKYFLHVYFPQYVCNFLPVCSSVYNTGEIFVFLYCSKNCAWQASKCPKSTVKGGGAGGSQVLGISAVYGCSCKVNCKRGFDSSFPSIRCFFFPLSNYKTLRIMQRICNISSFSISILSFLVMYRVCLCICFCEPRVYYSPIIFYFCITEINWKVGMLDSSVVVSRPYQCR